MGAIMVVEYAMKDLLAPSEASNLVEDPGFRLVFTGFLLFATVFTSRMFSSIDKLNVTTMLWRLFLTGMAGVTIILLVAFAFRATDEMTLHRYLVPVYMNILVLAFSLFFLYHGLRLQAFYSLPTDPTQSPGLEFLQGIFGSGIGIYAVPDQ